MREEGVTKGVLLCLGTKKGLEVLREIDRINAGFSLYVCTFKDVNVSEAFDDSIKEIATSVGYPVVSWKTFRSDPIGFLEHRGIGSILCIGWRYLIPDEALEHLNGRIIIAHDSLLPKLRGFAPLPTALIIGEQWTGVTFLRAATGVDVGQILWQGRVPIGAQDTISDLVDKVTPLYIEGVRRFLHGELTESIPQDDRQATYSIWRDEIDYRLDWSQDSARIERTIRALGPPYLGAQSTLAGELVVIHRAEEATDLNFAIRQPGKIWALDEVGRPTVICGRGLLKILSMTRNGDSVLPLNKLRQRFS
jgi:methionyl-tRNA formyltransferase